MSDVIVTMKHIRAANMCSGGPREFFKKHDLDWNDFLKNGIPAEKLEATKDINDLNVIEIPPLNSHMLSFSSSVKL